MSRAVTPKDIAAASMGGCGSRQIAFRRPPPVRPQMCAACPFQPGIDVFTALKCQVLKDELRARPNAVWMCHETSDGGSRPTDKSIICRGAHDWRGTEENR